MDPDANLIEMLRLATEIHANEDHSRRDSAADASRLAELIFALDGWIRKGGFLPHRWQGVQHG